MEHPCIPSEHPCISSLHPCVGSGEQENPSPTEPSGWAWILGTLALPGQSQRVTGPRARATFSLNCREALSRTGGRLGSSPLGSTGPDKPHASVSPSVHQGWMWCWSPWAVCVEVRGQRAPWAVCSLVSPALPGRMSPLSPAEAAELGSAVGDGAVIHGRLGFCSVKPSALGIDSLWVRLQTPFPWHPPPPLASQPPGCSGSAEREPSHPRTKKSPFAPCPPRIEQERYLPSPAVELSLAVGSMAWRPQNTPLPLSCRPHAGAQPGQLARSAAHGLCSAVPALGKIRRPPPVFFPVGSRSWDACEAGGCAALLSSCLQSIPAGAGRARCLLPACLAEGSAALPCVGSRGPLAPLHPPRPLLPLPHPRF